MDTLFHFVFSIIAGMAIFRGTHKLPAIISLAFLSILVDTDHFFGMVARGTFHNVFIIVLVPFMAFLALYLYNGRKSFNLQIYALTLMLMMLGHVAADMFYGGGVELLYPVSMAKFSVPALNLPSGAVYGQATYENFISRDGIALAVYALILMAAFFIEDFIYFFEKKHETVRRALRDVKKDLF